MKSLLTVLLSLALMAGGAAPGWAQSGAKEDVKEAGHATKKAGSAIKKGTKAVVHAGAKQTRKGAAAVEQKTDKK